MSDNIQPNADGTCPRTECQQWRPRERGNIYPPSCNLTGRPQNRDDICPVAYKRLEDVARAARAMKHATSAYWDEAAYRMDDTLYRITWLEESGGDG